VQKTHKIGQSSDYQPWAMNPFWRERISMVDLIVLTSLEELLFMLKILLFCKTSYHDEEVDCTEPVSVNITWTKILAADMAMLITIYTINVLVQKAYEYACNCKSDNMP
jgi:hypothetical protein